MNNERRDSGASSSNQQQPSSGGGLGPTTSSTINNMMGPPSASLTAVLLDRAPRRSALQNREGTGYIPRIVQREGYDAVLASQNTFGKRSGQIIVNTESADPNAFFDANNNQNLLQQQLHRDDQSSVLSLSNITMNDSDSAMSMISSKTAVTFLSSGDEKSPDEDGLVTKGEDKTSMEYVTSSSEDDTSVKQAKPPTVTIKQPKKKPESPSLPLPPPQSPVLSTISEEPATVPDIIAPPTPTYDYEQGGLDDDGEYNELFKDNTFEPEPKKQKISTTKKSKKYIYEKSSTEEDEDEQEIDDLSDDREQRRGVKSRQQRQALLSFRSSLPEPESESGTESESDKSSQPKQPSLEDSGIGPTQLDRSNVDLGQDFYQDEEAKLSQKQTSLVGEKYLPRKEFVKDLEYVDETDDEETNDYNTKIRDDDEDFKPESEGEDETDILNMTLVSTQNDDVDNGTDAYGIQSANAVEARLRRKVTKPCRYWENERPLPKEANKLLKVKPVIPEPVPAKKKGAPPKKKKIDPISDMTGGIYKVVNEYGDEEEMQIFASAEMHTDSHIRFRKDESKSGGYAAIKTSAESAQLSIFSSLTERGIGVGTMIIKPGGVKPSSNTSTQSEVLYVLNGQATVVVHKNPPITMKRGSVIHVPPYNSYSMKNSGNMDCKLLYVFSDTKSGQTEEEEENAGMADEETENKHSEKEESEKEDE